MKTLLSLLILLVGVVLIGSWTTEISDDAKQTSAANLLTLPNDVGTGEVLGIRELTLKEGVDPKDFENFVTEEYLPSFRQHFPGVKLMVVKGERGKDLEKYLYVMIFDSIHERNMYWPEPDQNSKVLEVIMETSGDV